MEPANGVIGTGASEAKVDEEAAGVELATRTEGLGVGGRQGRDGRQPA